MGDRRRIGGAGDLPAQQRLENFWIDGAIDRPPQGEGIGAPDGLTGINSPEAELAILDEDVQFVGQTSRRPGNTRLAAVG